MKTLVLLVGPAGSGKSTYALNLCTENGYHYINQDSQGKDGHLKQFQVSLADPRGISIVVDRMNFDKKQRERYIKPARDAGYRIEIVVFHVPRQTCFDRMMNRKGHPTINGKKAWEGMAGQSYSQQTKEMIEKHQEELKAQEANSALDTFFTKYERVEDSEADLVTRLGWDAKQTAIWCDLDSTLCNTTHRDHFMDKSEGKKPNWKAFFDNMGEDKCNEWCKDILSKYDTVVLCSGRPDSHRNITESWLLNHNITYDHLFMRHRADFRKDDIVKLQFYEFEVKTRYNLLFAIDDRDQVVKILRENGVVVLQCDYGNF